MRRFVGAALAAGLLAACAGQILAAPSHAEGPLIVQVTSPADIPGSCPSTAGCTFRGAIELVNSLAAPDAQFLIRFSGSAFPLAGATIELSQPLPAVTANDVTIDTFGLGVRIHGSQLAESPVDGLVLAGDRGRVHGLEISTFGGSCLVLTGANGTAGGLGASETVHLGSCATGITIAGERSQLLGAQIGFTRSGEASGVGTGVAIRASNVSAGPATGNTIGINTIGNAAVGISIGGEVDPITGVAIRANRIGKSPAGKPAPVGTGIRVEHHSAGVTIQDNVIANVALSGIVIVPDENGASVSDTRASGNSFSDISGLPIDLGANGLIEPNDPNDTDPGPNGLQNHPTISRPTAANIAGVVTGCGGCTVEIYAADHEAGATMDHDFSPLPGMVGLTNSDGDFSIPASALPPGLWVSAIATGVDGTSEFGPSVRVGAGSVVCGSTFLAKGWNHSAYLGPPVALGNVFPANGDAGAVSAIYELVDGTGGYRRWFPGAGPARTLTELVPGATYWFFAERAIELPGGFAFSDPIAVEFRKGWNDFVYLGATADSRDVLRGMAGGHGGPFQFAAGAWQWGGRAETPRWAVDFSELVACEAYHIKVESGGVLVPLQP